MRWTRLLLGFGLLAGAGPVFADLVLAAPPSLARCVNEITQAYRTGGGAITVIFDNSDDQSVEIETSSRSYDVIILGDPHALYRLIGKGLVQPAQPLASSPLILAASEAGAEVTLDEHFHERLAIFDPDSDGIGVVSREILSQLGLWEGKTERLQPLASAAAMARALQSGQVRYALMLHADLTHLPALRQVGQVDGQDYLYMAAAIRRRYRPESAQFLDFLRSPAVAAILRAQGFTPQQN